MPRTRRPEPLTDRNLTDLVRALLAEQIETETQTVFAKRIGWSDAYVSDLRRGNRGINLKVMMRLLKALNVPFEALAPGAQRWQQGIRPASKCVAPAIAA